VPRLRLGTPSWWLCRLLDSRQSRMARCRGGAPAPGENAARGRPDDSYPAAAVGGEVIVATHHIALGVFAGIGADQAALLPGAIDFGAWPAAAALAFLTGAGGGLIRDLLLRRPPAALLTPYGAVAAAGGLVHLYLLRHGIPAAWVLTTLLTAWLAQLSCGLDGRRSTADGR
jgi:hypothetical protein